MKSVCQKILFKNLGTGWLNCIMVSVYGMCIGSFMRFNPLHVKIVVMLRKMLRFVVYLQITLSTF